MDIYQHFREEERAFIDQVLAWKEEVERSFQLKLTDFLDPREQHILKSIIGTQTDIQAYFFGGSRQVERQRAIIAPYYEMIDNSQFEMVLLEGTYPSKFVQLTHRDVLGALMSLGLKRKKIGDLRVSDGIVQVIVAKEIADYVQFQLQGIKKSSIKLIEQDLSHLKESDEKWFEQEGTVSSLRLDAVIKEIYRISRQQASDYITKGAIKVNFRLVENPAFQMEQGDIVSFHKKGRSKIVKIEGKTKKDKWRITTAVLK